MKRTPLKRKTPLRAGARGDIRRTAMKTYRRKPEDKVDPVERDHVLRRDGDCIGRVLARLGWVPMHTCANEFGDPLPHPVPYEALTLEHVKPELRAGLRAMSSKTAEFKRGDRLRRWSVAACPWANVNGWTSANRTFILIYLERLERAGRI